MSREYSRSKHANDIKALAANDSVERNRIYGRILEDAFKKPGMITYSIPFEDQDSAEFDIDDTKLTRPNVRYIHHFHHIHDKRDNENKGVLTTVRPRDEIPASEIQSTVMVASSLLYNDTRQTFTDLTIMNTTLSSSPQPNEDTSGTTVLLVTSSATNKNLIGVSENYTIVMQNKISNHSGGSVPLGKTTTIRVIGPALLDLNTTTEVSQNIHPTEASIDKMQPKSGDARFPSRSGNENILPTKTIVQSKDAGTEESEVIGHDKFDTIATSNVAPISSKRNNTVYGLALSAWNDTVLPSKAEVIDVDEDNTTVASNTDQDNGEGNENAPIDEGSEHETTIMTETVATIDERKETASSGNKSHDKTTVTADGRNESQDGTTVIREGIFAVDERDKTAVSNNRSLNATTIMTEASVVNDEQEVTVADGYKRLNATVVSTVVDDVHNNTIPTIGVVTARSNVTDELKTVFKDPKEKPQSVNYTISNTTIAQEAVTKSGELPKTLNTTLVKDDASTQSHISKRSIRVVENNHDTDLSIVTSVVAPVRVQLFSCILKNECGIQKDIKAVQLIPRNALSVLFTLIEELKTQSIYEPACESHALSHDDMFPIDGMYAADTNAFAVKVKDDGSCLFVFYGGRDVVKRFQSLPPKETLGTASLEIHRPDLFTVAIYVPQPISRTGFNAGSTTMLPIATKHSRMLFVINQGTSKRLKDTGRSSNRFGSVYGAMQMWFRNTDDMRAEFGRLQKLLCLDWLVAHKSAQITIAFTIELPAKKIIQTPSVDVEKIWKEHLASNGMYCSIPVEMYVNHSHGYYENKDFDSVTVHGYLMDGKTVARVLGEELKVQIDPTDVECHEECGVRREYLLNA